MSDVSNSLYNDIHEFWFEGITDQIRINKKKSPFNKWFVSTPDSDALIIEKFEKLYLDSKVEECAYSNNKEQLSLILLFDQLSRNIYRNTSKAYSFDNKACELAKDMVTFGRDSEMMLIERFFIYMPFMHSENIANQDLSVECFERLLIDAKRVYADNVPYYKNNLHHAKNFRKTIAEHGRFIHRDKILNR